MCLVFVPHSRTHQEGEFQQLEIWTWKSYARPPILHNFKWAETWWRFFMEYIRNIGANKHQRGPPGGHNPPGRVLVGCGLLGPPPVPIFWYISHFDLKKIRGGLSGWSVAASRRNLGRSTFALRRSDFVGGTSLPKGEIIVIIITNNSPILGRAISINIFTSTISSQTLVHLLYSILLLELQIVARGWLVVLIISCSRLLYGLFGGRLYVQIHYAY